MVSMSFPSWESPAVKPPKPDASQTSAQKSALPAPQTRAVPIALRTTGSKQGLSNLIHPYALLQKPSANVQDPEALKALEGAMYLGNISKIEEALQPFSDINAIHFSDGLSLLTKAILFRNKKLVEYLLNEKGMDPNRLDRAGNAPLVWAVTFKGQDIVDALLRHQVNVNLPNSTSGEKIFLDTQGKTALAVALDKKSIGVMKQLLDQGADPNIPDTDGKTLLDKAIENRAFSEASLLIDHHATLDYKDPNKINPIERATASEAGSVSAAFVHSTELPLLQKLLNSGANPNQLNSNGRPFVESLLTPDKNLLLRETLAHGVNPNQTDDRGVPLLSKAKDVATAEALLESGATVNPVLQEGVNSPLLQTCLEGNDAVFDLLFLNGADVNAKNTKTGVTPLLVATKSGSSRMVATLLGAQADPNIKGPNGITPLMQTIQNGNMVQFLQLINHKDKKGNLLVDRSLQNNQGQTALQLAQVLNRSEMVRVLQEGADVLKTRSVPSTTLARKIEQPQLFPKLVQAIQGREKPEKLALMLRSLQSVNQPITKEGKTPLMVAAEADNIEALAQLLQAGADINQANAAGQTALMQAVAGNAQNAASFLVRHEANLNDRNAKGETALYQAITAKQPEMARFLLEKGANANLPDNDETTPLDLSVDAFTSREPNLKAYGTVKDLLDFQADPNSEPWLLRYSLGSLALVRTLLDHGTVFGETENRGNIIHNLLFDIHAPVLEELLNRQVITPNEVLAEGGAPLTFDTNDVGVLKMLLSSKKRTYAAADVNAIDPERKMSRLTARVSENEYAQLSEPVVETLLNANADVFADQAEVNHPTSALYYAAANPDKINILLRLLAENIDVNREDAVTGDTALMIAVKKENLLGVKALLEKGADRNLKSRYGETAVDLATSRGFVSILKALQE